MQSCLSSSRQSPRRSSSDWCFSFSALVWVVRSFNEDVGLSEPAIVPTQVILTYRNIGTDIMRRLQSGLKKKQVFRLLTLSIKHNVVCRSDGAFQAKYPWRHTPSGLVHISISFLRLLLNELKHSFPSQLTLRLINRE